MKQLAFLLLWIPATAWSQQTAPGVRSDTLYYCNYAEVSRRTHQARMCFTGVIFPCSEPWYYAPHRDTLKYSYRGWLVTLVAPRMMPQHVCDSTITAMLTEGWPQQKLRH